MTGVLVTGASGLLGSAACRRLAERGVPFTALSRARVDLTVPGALDDVAPPTAVIHAAAALPRSFDQSTEAARLNRLMDDAVMLAAERWGARVVYPSGTSLYAPGGDDQLDETAEIAPRGPYLREKARTESLGATQAARTGIPFTSLRISAPFGPGQRARTVIRHWVEKARAGGPLEYFGTGSREQSFTWVDDVGDALVAALEAPGGRYNVAGGEPITMRDLAHLIATAARLRTDAVRASSHPDPQEGAVARYDVTLAREVLGWTARTSLRAGVEVLLKESR